jgi:hypothetical protein
VDALSKYTSIDEAKRASGIRKPHKSKEGAKAYAGAAQIRNDRHDEDSRKDMPNATRAEQPNDQIEAGSVNKPAPEMEVDESVLSLPPLAPDFIMTDADEDAFADFVEAVGGFDRSAQVFQAGWNRRNLP